MQATLPPPQYTLRETAQMTGGVVTSLAFHFFVILLFSLGLPFTKPEPMIVSPPITVEIADIDELTQTDRAPSLTKPPKEQPKQETEPPPPESYKPPTMTAEAPPDMSTPQAPDIKDAVPEIVPAPPPEPLERKDIKEPEVKKKPPPPPAKPVTKKPEQPKAQKDFQTLLKNLTPDVEETSGERKKPDLDVTNEQDVSPLAQRAQKITVGEEEAVRAQIGGCWNILAGAKFAENLVVRVRMEINPDRTVKSAQVINALENTGNPHFRAAADAALRAIRHPNCSPLNLPPEKYEGWKVLIFNFNPSEML